MAKIKRKTSKVQKNKRVSPYKKEELHVTTVRIPKSWIEELKHIVGEKQIAQAIREAIFEKYFR